MNREETLVWIDMVLGALDKHEVMAIIQESADQFDGEFFETINSETERLKSEGKEETAQRLTRIARAIASVRQNRSENL